MAIVKTDVPMTSRLCEDTILALVERYPFLRTEKLGATAFGRSLRTLVVGNGPRKVVYSAAHHANEWITTPVLLKFAEELAAAMESRRGDFRYGRRPIGRHGNHLHGTHGGS